MKKQIITTKKAENRIIANIIQLMIVNKNFLLLGHTNPDEDCIASMVAFALLLKKFDTKVAIFLGALVHEHFHYLLNICKYNCIAIVGPDSLIRPPAEKFDSIGFFDTAKPQMVDHHELIAPAIMTDDVRKFEFDHHLGGDSAYIGDDDYCLVTEASSASELVGHLVVFLSRKKSLLETFQISELFTRNLVLAILTGIIGDSKMGKYLKSRRERRYYQKFSTLFNDMLAQKTLKQSNFYNKNEVFDEIQRLSASEEGCYNYFKRGKQIAGCFGYVILNEKDIKHLSSFCDEETIVSVARTIADELAEESGHFSLVAYYDHPTVSAQVQFRVRRSERYKKFDLRQILTLFNIANGGGHEGAIGFRVPKNQLADLNTYAARLMAAVEKQLTVLA